MAKFGAAIWLIALLLYYFVVFWSLTAMYNAESFITSKINPSLSFNNPGFLSQPNPFNDNGLKGCVGKSIIDESFNSIFCGNLIIQPLDILTCNSIEGCYWQNDTFYTVPVLNWTFKTVDAGCFGSVNLTVYGMKTQPGQDIFFDKNGFDYDLFCNSSGLQDPSLCTIFGCYWKDPNSAFFGPGGNSYTQPTDFNTKVSTASIWDTINWVITMQYSFGLGQPWDGIVNFIVFYIPFTALIIAIYYMVPFI